MPPSDILVLTTANVLTTLRNTLLDQAQRDSLAGEPLSVIAERLLQGTGQAFDLLSGELATLGRDAVNRRDGTPISKQGT